MINVLSYLGISLQSEVCLWTLVGLMSTIFDATLFKTNANLKQVWQMNMPMELSCLVQRILRTMISGVMLVQCFTVYVFLASYIVLLYPVFLEERPTLVLPWLLLAAIRKLLCELMSLAMGLGVCLLLGPARTACIKFVINKMVSIMPFFYMWMLVFSYYHALKIRSSFKSFSVVPAIENDYGLELAVRRRRTKSLFDETQLRKKLVASLYGGRTSSDDDQPMSRPKSELISRMTQATETDSRQESLCNISTMEMTPSAVSNRLMSIGTFEGINDTLTHIPRDVDRILDQFTMMMLQIGVFMTKTEEVPELINTSSFQRNTVKTESLINKTISSPSSAVNLNQLLNNSNKEKLPSYVKDYPLIFMKKHSDFLMQRIEKKGSIDLSLNKALHQTTSFNTPKMKFDASQESKPLENQTILPTVHPNTIEQATSPLQLKQALSLSILEYPGISQKCVQAKPKPSKSICDIAPQKDVKNKICLQQSCGALKLENATSTKELNIGKPSKMLNHSSSMPKEKHETPTGERVKELSQIDNKKTELATSSSKLNHSVSINDIETSPQNNAETQSSMFTKTLQTIKLKSPQASQYETSLLSEVVSMQPLLKHETPTQEKNIELSQIDPKKTEQAVACSLSSNLNYSVYAKENETSPQNNGETQSSTFTKTLQSIKLKSPQKSQFKTPSLGEVVSTKPLLKHETPTRERVKELSHIDPKKTEQATSLSTLNHSVSAKAIETSPQNNAETQHTTFTKTLQTIKLKSPQASQYESSPLGEVVSTKPLLKHESPTQEKVIELSQIDPKKTEQATSSSKLNHSVSAKDNETSPQNNGETQSSTFTKTLQTIKLKSPQASQYKTPPLGEVVSTKPLLKHETPTRERVKELSHIDPKKTEQATSLSTLNHSVSAKAIETSPQNNAETQHTTFTKTLQTIKLKSPQDSQYESSPLGEVVSTKPLLKHETPTREKVLELSQIDPKKTEQATSSSKLNHSVSAKDNETSPQNNGETQSSTFTKTLQTIKLKSPQASQYETSLLSEVASTKPLLESEHSKLIHKKLIENIAVPTSNQTETSEPLKQELAQVIPSQPQNAESSNKQSFFLIERKIALKLTRKGKHNLDGAIIENTETITAHTDNINEDNTNIQLSKDDLKKI